MPWITSKETAAIHYKTKEQNSNSLPHCVTFALWNLRIVHIQARPRTFKSQPCQIWGFVWTWTTYMHLLSFCLAPPLWFIMKYLFLFADSSQNVHSQRSDSRLSGTCTSGVGSESRQDGCPGFLAAQPLPNQPFLAPLNWRWSIILRMDRYSAEQCPFPPTPPPPFLSWTPSPFGEGQCSHMGESLQFL